MTRGGGEGTPYNGLYKGKVRFRPKGISFLGLRYMIVEATDKRVGKSVISVCKNALKGRQMRFMDVKKSIKLSSFVISSCFKDNAFTADKRGSNFLGERGNIC